MPYELDQYTRRRFLQRITATGVGLSAGALGLVGCSGDDTNEANEDAEQSSGPAAAGGEGGDDPPSESPSPSEGELRMTKMRLESTLDMMKTFTEINFEEIDGEPWKKILGMGIVGAPSQVGWLVPPSGRALGFQMKGTGGRFADAVSKTADEMMDARAKSVFPALAESIQGPPTSSMEMIFGGISWFRVGVQIDTFEELRRVLQEVDVSIPKDVQSIVDRGENDPGAQPAGLQMVMSSAFEDMNTSWLAAGVRFGKESQNPPVPEHTPTRPVIVHDTLGDPSVTWYQCKGLKDRELIEWQSKRGYGKEAGGRVGEVHGSLGKHPAWMIWQEGSPTETLTYRFDESIDY